MLNFLQLCHQRLILHNYFDCPVKLFSYLYLVKFLNKTVLFVFNKYIIDILRCLIMLFCYKRINSHVKSRKIRIENL